MKPAALACLSVALIATQTGIAGPLEDAVTRVNELNHLVQSQNERLTQLEAKLQNQGLLGLLNQIETLKSEVSRLRGAQEEQTYRQEAADKRTKDLFFDLDERIKEIANRPVSAPPPVDSIRLQTSQSLVVSPLMQKADSESETTAYEIAHGLIKSGKYREAVVAFQKFVSQYPSGPLAANALYWIGISQVTGLSNFKAAAESYTRLLEEYPNSPKVPDALLSLARAQIQMEEKELALVTLNRLLTNHATSKAAENGKKLLATMN